jgi:hypothetical protein
MPKQMRRLRILAFQLVLGLLLLEVCLKIYNPLPFRVRGNRIVLPVRQRYTFSHSDSGKLDAITYHTKNSLGFRGPEPPRDFDRHLTILTIGGSTTECMLLSDGKTWTDTLEHRVHTFDPTAWVNNAGFDGQSTYGHLVLLRDYIVGLRPTIAIFLLGINDVHLDRANDFDDTLGPVRSFERALGGFVVDHSEIAALGTNLYSAARTHLVGYGNSEMDFKALPHVAVGKAAIERAIADQANYLDAYGARLARLVDLSRSHEIEPILVTQPALYGDAIDPATGLDLSTMQFHVGKSGGLEWRVLEAYNDVTRRIASAEGLLLVDLGREMPKDSRFYYDFMHYTNAGAAQVGTLVANHLVPYLRARAGRDWRRTSESNPR